LQFTVYRSQFGVFNFRVLSGLGRLLKTKQSRVIPGSGACRQAGGATRYSAASSGFRSMNLLSPREFLYEEQIESRFSSFEF
jgi:hypothetical protein